MMRSADAAVVVAHYHPRGLLRDDFVVLLSRLESMFGTVLLVSTKLEASQCDRLPRGVSIKIRQNFGYDFYSYRVGLESLGDLGHYQRLILMNSSFLCVDADKLMHRFFATEHEKCDVLGLTVSEQRTRHLQSFLLSFGPRCLRSPAFRRWWTEMVPIDERERVIEQYEIGLSRFLRNNGFTLSAKYVPTAGQMGVALLRSLRRGKLALHPRALNPTQFYWDYLLARFGIVKVGLVRSDPYSLLDEKTRRRLAGSAGEAGIE